MDIIELSSLFKSYIDTEADPVVFCDIDYKIIFMNKAAQNALLPRSAEIGKSIRPYLDEERLSRTDAVIEWFKESTENNVMYVGQLKDQNVDLYITALRNSSGELVGFCNKNRSRDPENTEPYTLI